MSKDYAINFKSNSSFNFVKWAVISCSIIIVSAFTWILMKHPQIFQLQKKSVVAYTLPENINEWTSPHGAYALMVHHSTPLDSNQYQSHNIDAKHDLIGPFNSVKEVYSFLQTTPTHLLSIPDIIFIPHINSPK